MKLALSDSKRMFPIPRTMARPAEAIRRIVKTAEGEGDVIARCTTGRARNIPPTLSGPLFDFRGKCIFARYDCCEFVECMLLIDHSTEQLAFTQCVFKDCNVDTLDTADRAGHVGFVPGVIISE